MKIKKFQFKNMNESVETWSEADVLTLPDSSNEKLISVHMFSRHGARTPCYLIKGLEEVHL